MKKEVITQSVLDELSQYGIQVDYTKRTNNVIWNLNGSIADVPRIPKKLRLVEIYGGDVINGEIVDAFLVFQLDRREVRSWEFTLLELLIQIRDS